MPSSANKCNKFSPLLERNTICFGTLPDVTHKCILFKRELSVAPQMAPSISVHSITISIPSYTVGNMVSGTSFPTSDHSTYCALLNMFAMFMNHCKLGFLGFSFVFHWELCDVGFYKMLFYFKLLITLMNQTRCQSKSTHCVDNCHFCILFLQAVDTLLSCLQLSSWINR